MSDFDDLCDKVVKGGYDFGTGSWSVVNENIKMKLNNIGEYHPFLEKESRKLSSDEILNLKESCLSISTDNEDTISKQLFANIPKIKYDKKIGYYSGLFIGHVLEEDFRKNGSSGGMGTWILSELVKKNKVDYVISVGENNNDEILFKYKISNEIKDIKRTSGTKYYPVEFSEVINFVKNNPGRYVIVGLPSFIMELRLLANLNPIIKERIKYTVGLVCGHQKSKLFADFLAWQCGIEPGKLRKINFRKKMNGSTALDYAIEVTGEINGHEQTVTRRMRNLAGKDWGEGLFKVSASDFTDDVMNETADITLGDAWLPEYAKDSKGNNIIIVRNPEIESIIENAIDENRISVDSSNVETIYKSQASHYRHTRYELRYRLFKKEKKGQWHPIKREVSNKKLPWIRKKIQVDRERICVEAPLAFIEAKNNNDINIFFEKMKSSRSSYENIYRIKRIFSKVKRIPSKVEEIIKH